MKFIEGVFKDWGYEVVCDEFGVELLDGGLWMQFKNLKIGKNVVVKDVIVDVMLQQILLCFVEYDVIVILNLNGDYFFDVLVVEVGGIGIVFGVNLFDLVVMFEVIYGIVLKYVGQDKVNLGLLIFFVEMMLCYMGWIEVVDLIIKGINGVIVVKIVIYDFECLMDGVILLFCLEFGDVMIVKMQEGLVFE